MPFCNWIYKKLGNGFIFDACENHQITRSGSKCQTLTDLKPILLLQLPFAFQGRGISLEYIRNPGRQWALSGPELNCADSSTTRTHVEYNAPSSLARYLTDGELLIARRPKARAYGGRPVLHFGPMIFHRLYLQIVLSYRVTRQLYYREYLLLQNNLMTIKGIIENAINIELGKSYQRNI